MWSWVLLCICTSLVHSAHNPGWQDHHEYVYQVRSRSLASLNENTNNYSGIFLKAKLIIKSTSDGKLYGQLWDPQYAPLHGTLEDGWQTEVPDSELSYKKLDPTLNKPFQMVITNGVIRELYVSKDISNWEANIIKSVASQFQLDTEANNYMKSYINAVPEYGSDDGVYKTMEDTVTGITETLYNIHPLSEYELQTKPWLAPLGQDGQLIEIYKSKNFTKSENQPSYHFGFHGIEDFEPQNRIGDFLTRTSDSRVIVTGNLTSYTIQSSVTVDQILMSPTFNEKQRGLVTTMVNVTLQSMKPQSESLEEVPNPVQVGLVYAYNQPFESKNEPRAQKNEMSLRRKLESLLSSQSDSESSSSEEDRNMWQEKPKLDKAPASPLLPFTIGYNGQSIKKSQNIIESVRRLAKMIGQECRDSEKVIKEKTIGKFVVLSSLVRLMDYDEIQEVAHKLYDKENHHIAIATWEAFRDAVAQAGTGPSLLAIDQWIEKEQISGEKASEIVCRAAEFTRQPTLEYMKMFYRIVEKEKVQRQANLNESALLCYTTLVYDVYVNEKNAHNKYPVYSFGQFRTSEGEKFVEEQIIPELTRKLNDAIVRADVHKIHTYIRALGNIGHRQILAAFKPYLEGQKQVSQFQRLLMVVALDKLVSSSPAVARAVLYRIYQNTHEDEQVRVAAVAQLMRTVPESSMLQRMAQYTNVDSHHYVNAAVKSAIESASQLEGSEHAKLCSAALSARHLLTTKQYGFQYSQEKLRSHVIEHLKMAYKQTVQTFGSEDYSWPKGINYKLRERHGGFRQQVVNMQAVVSSIDDLINVFEQQTNKYQEDKKKKQAQDGHLHKMSSEYIAKLWNMENEQREQLEGVLYFQIGALQKIWSLNNHTVQNISQVINEVEEELKNGKSFDFRKMWIQNEIALSFPTAMGLPFIYTYDKPMYVNVEAKVRAQSSPPIFSGKHVQKPNALSSEFEFHASITGRTQSQFGIFTPFDSQRYSAGYDKNFQVVVPIRGNIEADLINSQIKIELDPKVLKNTNLFYYSSIPFTANNDIYEPKPEKKIIRSKYPHVVNKLIGHESIGIAVNVHMTSDQSLDIASLYDKFRHHDLVSGLLNPWLDQNIHHSEMHIKVNGVQSLTEKIVLYIGYQHSYVSDRQEKSDDILLSKIDKISDEPTNRQNRQKRFMELSVQDIKNAVSHVVDAHVQFLGQSTMKYTATVALSKSNIYPKSRVILHLKKQDKEGVTNSFYLESEGNFPNTNGLNMDYAMDMDTTSNIDIKAGFGPSYEKSQKMTTNIMLSKTQERQQYLREQPQYQECKRQMKQGNYHLPSCAKMTQEANLLDQFEMNIDYEAVDYKTINHIYQVYTILRHQMYPRVEENIIESRKSNENNLYVKGRFQPDLRAMNFSIKSDFGKIEVRDFQINDWWKQLLVVHPVFHAQSRVMSHVHKYFTYRPICVVDQTAVSTFDNKTYPVTFGEDWTVVHQYVPRRPSFKQDQSQQSVYEQLREERESCIIWTRTYQQHLTKKEIKMIIQTPMTNGKVVELKLQPGQSYKLPRLFINDEEVDYKNQEDSTKYEQYMQVYPLPNNEIKVQLQQFFYLIYDGSRVKLSVEDSKFRDASRGLCGTFIGEQETDFASPQNCILRTPEEFVRSYTYSDSRRYQRDSTKCYQKQVKSVEMVSSDDIGRSVEHQRKNHQRTCVRHQTRYVVMGDQICFTLRPLPQCKSSCKSEERVFKRIAVHCVQATSATNMIKMQIDEGATPDFSKKTETRQVVMELPTRCSA